MELTGENGATFSLGTLLSATYVTTSLWISSFLLEPVIFGTSLIDSSIDVLLKPVWVASWSHLLHRSLYCRGLSFLLIEPAPKRRFPIVYLHCSKLTYF